MKNVITKPVKPALLSQRSEGVNNQSKQALFRKHNFCVATLDGTFKPFSYEASYAGDLVEISIYNASIGNKVKVLAPRVDLIAKKAVFNKTGTMNTAEYVVVYEDFCDALFDFICEHISESEDFTEGDI